MLRLILLNFVLVLALLLPACKKAEPAPAPQAPSRARNSVSSETQPISDAQIPAKVREIIAQQTGVRIAEIKSTTDLHTDLKMDELDDVELVMELEDRFGMRIPDEDAKRYQTVQQVIDYVLAHRKSER